MDSRAIYFGRLLGVAALTRFALGLGEVAGQVVIPQRDPNETVGERPYEMVWAKRKEVAPPTIRFDQLEGWRMEVSGGAEAELRPTLEQQVWERPVGRLRYRGNGEKDSRPSIRLYPPKPVSLPSDADSVDAWVYGNRWAWVNPPDTPPLSVIVHLRDGKGAQHALLLDRIRWQEWWLMHKKLPAWPAPLQFESLELSGGWQKDWRKIYLDSFRFYREVLAPLKFAPRPKRNLELLEGQSGGANTGPGRLPFPTREKTILPMHFPRNFKCKTSQAHDGVFVLEYAGNDCRLSYRFDARRGLDGIEATVDGQRLGRLLSGAGLHFSGDITNHTLVSATLQDSRIETVYADGTRLRLRLWQKSLVVDIVQTNHPVERVDLGRVAEVNDAHRIVVPYLNFGEGPHPAVLLAKAGAKWVFGSVWVDWYRSNGSELYASEETSAEAVRINGGVRYHPRTDGRRNPVFERLFITVSPRFEEVLPSIANPVGRHAAEAVDRLWQESWGPRDYAQEMERSRKLRAYGIEKLIQCNHEIAWRDGGESFTLRIHAAPNKGGDAALQKYVAHQRSLGWLAGLYSNYTDFAPVNEFWSPDAVQRTPDGNWRSAWPRCWALKPLRAVEFDALLAPQIKQRYKPNSAYTDVHTAVAPWHYNDYDARVPGAGTFAQTFYAYGELLRNDSRVYEGPVFSEGTYQWMYAGLADGNYALSYDGRPLAKEPLLPVFDLYQIHPRECDIGMGWTAHFCQAMPNWQKPDNLDRAIDRFLLHTLAYGHIGWLVEEAYGWDRTCRSYYMLQQVQARYGLKPPERVAYWSGQKLLDVSEALVEGLPTTRRQLYIRYPGGLELWLNDHATENWTVAVPGREEPVVLPPAGWAAATRDESLVSFSALVAGHRVDYLRSDAYVYVDGRGQRFECPEAVSDGALAMRPLKNNQLEVLHISGKTPFVIRRAFDRGLEAPQSVVAFDWRGRATGKVEWSFGTAGVEVSPVEGALRYVVAY